MKRSNPVWFIPVDTLKALLSKHSTLAAILRDLNRNTSGTDSRILRRRLLDEGLDCSHISLGLDNTKGKSRPLRRPRTFRDGEMPRRKDGRPCYVSKEHCLKTLFVKGNTGKRSKNRSVRHYVLKFEVFPFQCVKCGNIGEWLGEKLNLQLDHINGDPSDNRLDNLRWMCPNCHTQTPTHCSSPGHHLRRMPSSLSTVPPTG